ncbi:hypothetical protein DF186_18380, partial [Enterococcus hirae]
GFSDVPVWPGQAPRAGRRGRRQGSAPYPTGPSAAASGPVPVKGRGSQPLAPAIARRTRPDGKGAVPAVFAGRGGLPDGSGDARLRP